MEPRLTALQARLQVLQRAIDGLAQARCLAGVAAGEGGAAQPHQARDLAMRLRARGLAGTAFRSLGCARLLGGGAFARLGRGTLRRGLALRLVAGGPASVQVGSFEVA